MITGAALLVIAGGLSRPLGAGTSLVAVSQSTLLFQLQATSMAVTNLVFTGTSTAMVGSTATTVLSFTADTASLSGTTETDPCFQLATSSSKVRVVHTTGVTPAVTLTGVTLIVTSLTFTAGTTVTYDATNLPTGTAPVGLLASGMLTSVQSTSLGLIATAMTTPVHEEVESC